MEFTTATSARSFHSAAAATKVASIMTNFLTVHFIYTYATLILWGVASHFVCQWRLQLHCIHAAVVQTNP